MEEDIAGLTLQDDEDDAWLVDSGASEPVAGFDFYLVGCFLTAIVVRFEARRTIVANLWHLIEGIFISNLGEKRFLFWSYVEVDITRVIQGSPWTFSNHLLVFHRLEKGEDPLQVSLYYVDFWVQVHDLPIGFYNEQLARQFRNFLRTFLDYDSKALVFGLQKCLRAGYERLTLFCFLYGKLGHGESFYLIRLTFGAKKVLMRWDVSLRATPHRLRPKPVFGFVMCMLWEFSYLGACNTPNPYPSSE
ncbi:hypothetical protein Goklo_026951 [Gossypium klotzschianum]|uniref:DUF4283 domain-containing protein n=1 Tax=Gossypium klotzschianum TaxID=34286 RepID=A0A7J8TWT3_9ROSI|nr:hypothetical protein [Gossypium klotzschianum]